MITLRQLTDENKVQYVNGVMYMRIGNNVTDSTNVYDGKNIEVKLGTINFVPKGKGVFNAFTKSMKFVDGFVFEPEPNTVIECNTFRHIARYVYDLNEHFKEYGRLKQGGESNNE